MVHKRNKRGATSTAVSQLRIIGGKWRGRKLSFTPAEGLRPTADRVRETLFNWLAPDLRGARCLDLYCGSGALGLEALSRGAVHCDFVDTNTANVRQITAHLNVLQGLDRANCHAVDADTFLATAQRPWDIVFIDPPFGRGLAGGVCNTLQDRGLLRSAALLYLETGLQEAPPLLPASWVLHRDKTAGGVSYRLYHCPSN